MLRSKRRETDIRLVTGGKKPPLESGKLIEGQASEEIASRPVSALQLNGKRVFSKNSANELKKNGIRTIGELAASFDLENPLSFWQLSKAKEALDALGIPLIRRTGLDPEFALTMRVFDIPFSPAVARAFSCTDIVYLYELVQLTEEHLLKRKGFGRQVLGEIKTALLLFGYGLAMSVDEVAIMRCRKEIAEYKRMYEQSRPKGTPVRDAQTAILNAMIETWAMDIVEKRIFSDAENALGRLDKMNDIVRKMAEPLRILVETWKNGEPVSETGFRYMVGCARHSVDSLEKVNYLGPDIIKPLKEVVERVVIF